MCLHCFAAVEFTWFTTSTSPAGLGRYTVPRLTVWVVGDVVLGGVLAQVVPTCEYIYTYSLTDSNQRMTVPFS